MNDRIVAASILALFALGGTAQAASPACPHKDALGTSRILAVDTTTFPRVGLKSFPQSLPLRDKEVVLTFDDGPWPPTTRKVLQALADVRLVAEHLDEFLVLGVMRKDALDRA